MKKFKVADYKRSAAIFKAIGHPTRLWIIEQLLDGAEHCVCEFVDAVGVDFSTISKHLLVLKNVSLITDEKRGKWVFYKLNSDTFAKIKMLNEIK